MNIDYFPSKLAKDPRFCDRIAERRLLKDNADRGRHTVLLSPRRYGKSSLVHKVITELDLPFSVTDLFLAHHDQAITKRLLEGIGTALTQIVPVSDKALHIVQRYFAHLRVNLNVAGFSLQMSHEAGKVDAVEQIFDSLKSLAQLAKDKNKKVLLFIDEFQDIIKAESSKAIQGAIRHVAQDTSNIVFVFSGSHRRLLLNLFDDSNLPLYMLCDKIFLERISSNDYIPYIQEAIVHKWKKELDDMTLQKIFTFTECHPFYINMLCNELWRQDIFPTASTVVRAWQTCYEIERRRLISELDNLTTNQQDILKTLALGAIKEPSSHQFLTNVGLPVSSVQVGMKSLIEKDLIYRVKNADPWLKTITEGQYRIVDPLLAHAVRQYSF